MKNTLKLNTLVTTSVMVFMSLFLAQNQANAGVAEWLYGDKNEQPKSDTISLISSFLTTNKTSEQSEEKKPVVDNTPVKKEMIVSATAYSSTPDQTDDSPFITAWNTKVRDGIVAENFLRLGSKIKIPEVYGDKVFVVEDRMNRRYWHKVDIWFPDRESALEFGIKNIKIQILES